MDSNLFLSLEKYRPRTNRNPEEDFFTECFRFILDYKPSVKEKFIELLFSNDNRRKPRGKSRVSIYTQEKVMDFRPDMQFWIGSKKRILIENKIWSVQGKNINHGKERNQLETYLGFGDYDVAYITLAPEDIDKKTKRHKRFLGHFYWYQVYEIIEKHSKHDLIIENFLEYMRYKNMEPTDPIFKGELPHWVKFASLNSKMWEISDAVRDHLEDDAVLGKKYFLKQNGIKENNSDCKTNQNWIGFYFYKKFGRKKKILFFSGFNTYSGEPGFSVEFGIPTSDILKAVRDDFREEYKDQAIYRDEYWFKISRPISDFLVNEDTIADQKTSAINCFNKFLEKIEKSTEYKTVVRRYYK